MTGFQAVIEIEQIVDGHRVVVKRDGTIICEALAGTEPKSIAQLKLPVEFWTNLNALMKNVSEQIVAMTAQIKNLKEDVIKMDKQVSELESEKKKYIPIGSHSSRRNLVLAGITMGKNMTKR